MLAEAGAEAAMELKGERQATASSARRGQTGRKVKRKKVAYEQTRTITRTMCAPRPRPSLPASVVSALGPPVIKINLGLFLWPTRGRAKRNKRKFALQLYPRRRNELSAVGTSYPAPGRLGVGDQ